MKIGRRLLAAVAVPALVASGAVAAAGSAHAAGFTDTSVQGSNFVFQHFVTGPATDISPPLVPATVDITGVKAFPVPPSGGGVKYAILSGGDVDGVALSVTDTDLTSSTTGVISADGTLNHGAATSVNAVVKLSATDQFGDVAVVTVPVVVRSNSVVFDTANATELTTDEVFDLGIQDNNPNGSVVFSGKNTLDTPLTITEANLPAGLASGNPLLPGTAVPGTYKDQTVTAADANGAQATGEFLLTVNGGPTPAAPVPVLSHGAATFVAPTRENVVFDTTITTWVHFQIAGPGAINGHQGWVHAIAGQLNTGVYSGLEANHTYAVFFTPVDGQGSSVQIVGTHTGHVTFISNRP